MRILLEDKVVCSMSGFLVSLRFLTDSSMEAHREYSLCSATHAARQYGQLDAGWQCVFFGGQHVPQRDASKSPFPQRDGG